MQNSAGRAATVAPLGGPASVPATPDYAYQYDDIGNRITSTDLTTNRTYTANSLNQYSAITTSDSGLQTSSFTPQFDDDGNQTLIQTSTGVWSVQYNGENRPVLWTGGTQSAATNIVMSFDRMGRRVEYLETAGGSQSSATETNAYHRFVYDGYLCILRINGASNNAIDHVLGWDPSEPLATRPLVLKKNGQDSLFYTHEGKKNVSELVSFQQTNGMVAHYEYTPFGAVSFTRSNVTILGYDFMSYNTFRFSSEYYDGNVGLVYYNYRHFKPDDGRWTSREPLVELSMRHLRSIYAEGRIPNIDALTYSFVSNMAFTNYDVGGLFRSGENDGWGHDEKTSMGNCWRYVCNDKVDPSKRDDEPTRKIYPPGVVWNEKKEKIESSPESVAKGLKEKYNIDRPDKNGNCKECTYKVYLAFKLYGTDWDPRTGLTKYWYNDYHWYRQDTDDNCKPTGTWSHKRGDDPVETGVMDPEKHAKSIKYGSPGGFFCFPCEKGKIDADL